MSGYFTDLTGTVTDSWSYSQDGSTSYTNVESGMTWTSDGNGNSVFTDSIANQEVHTWTEYDESPDSGCPDVAAIVQNFTYYTDATLT